MPQNDPQYPKKKTLKKKHILKKKKHTFWVSEKKLKKKKEYLGSQIIIFREMSIPVRSVFSWNGQGEEG